MMSFDNLWNVMKKAISTYFLPEKWGLYIAKALKLVRVPVILVF